tara:strand:- start:75 stop:230 length:156 start_codon:yes stop_codon:yes gene_type:complete
MHQATEQLSGLILMALMVIGFNSSHKGPIRWINALAIPNSVAGVLVKLNVD